MALEAVARVAHRGAASTDNSGDGAGLLTQIPHRLFYRDAYRLGLHLQPGLPFGVGAFSCRGSPRASGRRWALVEPLLAEDGIPFLGWRDVPTNPAALGPHRAGVVPGDPPGAGGAAGPRGRRGGVGAGPVPGATRNGAAGGGATASRVLRLLALLPHHRLQSPAHRHPAALVLHRLPLPEYESAVAVFHQRYSTNTLPSWPLAQPFRLLAHNGEINTLWGNRNAMTMRQPMLASPVWGDEDRAAARGHLARWQRLGEPGQRDGVLARSGRDVGPHVDDDGAPGMGEVRRRGPRR